MPYCVPSESTTSSDHNEVEIVHENHQNLVLTPLKFMFTLEGEDPDAALGRERQRDSFSASTLATALWAGCSYGAIKQYLQHSPKATVMRCLSSQPTVEGHKILSYAIHRNDADCVRLLLVYGVSPNTSGSGDVPLLAFAIMRTKWSDDDHLEVVKALLAGGADPGVIPEDM